MKHSIEEIAATLQSNPAKGFEMIVRSFSEPVYNTIRRMVVSHDDANDLTQETFIKAYNSLGSLRNYKALASWLMRIATNEALRFLRNRGPVTVPLDTTADAIETGADPYFDYSNLEAVQLQKAIHSLPPKQQATFNLRYFDDLSFEEIAEIIDSTAQSVKVNYHFAKQKVAEYLKAYVAG